MEMKTTDLPLKTLKINIKLTPPKSKYTFSALSNIALELQCKSGTHASFSTPSSATSSP